MNKFINRICVQGVVGSIVKEFFNGTTIYKVAVVTSCTMKDKDGNCLIDNTWFNIIAPEQVIKCMPEQLKKGEWVKATGHVRLNEQAVARASIKVTADSLEIINN